MLRAAPPNIAAPDTTASAAPRAAIAAAPAPNNGASNPATAPTATIPITMAAIATWAPVPAEAR